MPWGISREGTRAQVAKVLDSLRDTAKQGRDAPESAMIDAATEMARATIALAGLPKNAAGQREAGEGLEDYRVSLNMSGHVADDGGTNLYMSVTTQPPGKVGTLADGPTPNEVAAAESTERIREAAARAAAPAAAPASETPATSGDTPEVKDGPAYG